MQKENLACGHSPQRWGKASVATWSGPAWEFCFLRRTMFPYAIPVYYAHESSCTIFYSSISPKSILVLRLSSLYSLLQANLSFCLWNYLFTESTFLSLITEKKSWSLSVPYLLSFSLWNISDVFIATKKKEKTVSTFVTVSAALRLSKNEWVVSGYEWWLLCIMSVCHAGIPSSEKTQCLHSSLQRQSCRIVTDLHWKHLCAFFFPCWVTRWNHSLLFQKVYEQVE